MIPIKQDIWDYKAAFAAAEAVGTEIDAYMRSEGMGVRVLDDDKLVQWVDEYVAICINQIKDTRHENEAAKSNHSIA